jgi:hypothetical protein
MEYKLDFNVLKELCSKKILSKVPEAPGSIVGAFNGGDYLGRPGKDIYFALPNLTDEQMEKLSDVLSDQYPFIAPNNHVGYAGCIRYIYGQFEKQGILRSNEDLKRMQKEGVEWDLPRKFMGMLKKKFEEKNNFYGLCIYYEMEAHRLGDEAFLNDDKEKVAEMEKHYMRSVFYAGKCGSQKQEFTPYFWACLYFDKIGDHERGLYYGKTTLEQMEKFCPSSKQGYLVKAVDCANYLKKRHPNEWKTIRNELSKNAKNDCIIKMLKKVK